MIRLCDVTKTYPSRMGHRTVLNRVNLSVGPGEKIGILGRNGAGKSTLIRILSGADPLLDGKTESAAGTQHVNGKRTAGTTHRNNLAIALAALLRQALCIHLPRKVKSVAIGTAFAHSKRACRLRRRH